MQVLRAENQADLAAFRVLGPLEVVNGSKPLPVRQGLHRRLLTVLLLRAGDLCPRSWLLAALWGERVPASGPSALRTAVRGLRRELGVAGEHIHTDQAGPVPGGYLVQAGERNADILAFRARAAAGRRAWYGGLPAPAASLLDGALRLWRGEPSDFPATPVAEALADQLRAELREAQDLAIDARLALGEHRAVIPLLREITTRTPLHEHAWAQLVLALHRCGDRAGALSAYAAARAVITAVYGSGPGPELEALHLGVLARTPGER
jgi:DNA-binding SARP family transcriptional activator